MFLVRWGLSRHFHYVPEILASLCWTLPGLFENVPFMLTHVVFLEPSSELLIFITPFKFQGIQYFYVFYLTILLFDRAIRDDERCRKK